MNKIVNKFWREEDKLISEWYLRKTGFTYSACEPL